LDFKGRNKKPKGVLLGKRKNPMGTQKKKNYVERRKGWGVSVVICENFKVGGGNDTMGERNQTEPGIQANKKVCGGFEQGDWGGQAHITSVLRNQSGESSRGIKKKELKTFKRLRRLHGVKKPKPWGGEKTKEF